MTYLYLRRVRCLLHFITLSTAQLLLLGPAAAQDRARCPWTPTLCFSSCRPPPGPTEDKALISECGDQIQPHWLAEAHNHPVLCPQCQGTAGKGLPLTGPGPSELFPSGQRPPASKLGQQHPTRAPHSHPAPRTCGCCSASCASHTPHNTASQKELAMTAFKVRCLKILCLCHGTNKVKLT